LIFDLISDTITGLLDRTKASEIEPWENASRARLENGPLRHSFQDANYHDRIVNERKRACTAGAGRARELEPIRGKLGSAEPDFEN
jgi:hypothetical protein